MTAKQYRKKPVVVEAMHLWSYTELLPVGSWNGHEGGAVWQWMHGHGVEVGLGQDADDEAAYGIIPTLEGDMRANIGDWIIRGVQGEFYPIKPDIFEATYEEDPHVDQ